MRKLGCFALCLALLLSGCGLTERSQNGPEMPTHIYREVSGSLLIDADVEGFPADGVLTLREAHTPVLTEEQADAILAIIGDQRIPESHSASSMDDNWDCTSGGSVRLDRATDTVPSGFYYRNWAVEDLRTASPYSRFPLAGSDKALTMSTGNDLDYMFREPREISVCTEEEATAQIRQILEIAGITDYVIDYVLYFDLDTLRQADELVCGPWGQEHAKLCMYEDKTFGPWLPFDWTEAYEGYYFHYIMTADGRALSYKAPTDVYIPSDGAVWINDTGIWQMDIREPFQVGRSLETQDTPISPEAALELVIDEYGERLVSFQRTVSKIALDYRCEPVDGGWQLRPMWVITIEEPAHDFYPEPRTLEYTVDALTGKTI